MQDTELESERYDPSVRKDLEQADWKSIMPRLLKYASAQCWKHKWLANRHLRPDELVQEAIALAFGVGSCGGYRNWCKEKCPDLAVFLEGIIRSVVNHKIEHIMKFPEDPLDPEDDRSKDIAEESSSDAKNAFELSADTPENSLVSAEKESEREKEILDKVKALKCLFKGDEEMEMVILCFEDNVSRPREIARITGYDIKRVYNILKRMRRKAEELRF